MESRLTPYHASPLIECRAALVFAPHPDDESLGCGGLTLALAQRGIPVQAVLLTSGDYGEHGKAGAGVREAETLAAAGAALEVDRPATYQTVIAEQQVVTDNLAVQVEAIAAATTVDEINNIVNPPTGVIHIGRTGQDLDSSYYVSFSSTSLTEADTELYIPGTSTVVTYGAYVPGEFDTPPGAFALGDYVIQIREVATSSIIAEFECPSGYEDISF